MEKHLVSGWCLNDKKLLGKFTFHFFFWFFVSLIHSFLLSPTSTSRDTLRNGMDENQQNNAFGWNSFFNQKVMDMNDNPPKFEQSSYSCSLSQRAVRGQFVTIVSASDPDYIDSNSLIYAIAEGNELQTYSIDAISGIITLVNMQNFAENQSTTLNISVTDSVYTSFIRVQINIMPGNMHSPVFSHSVYEVKTNENQLAGRLVITVRIFKAFFLIEMRIKSDSYTVFYFWKGVSFLKCDKMSNAKITFSTLSIIYKKRWNEHTPVIIFVIGYF